MGRSGTRGGLYRFLILLLCLAAIGFIGTEVFQTEKFTIISSGNLDKDVIINLSGISYGDNVFKINRELVKSRIESSAPFPVVQAISIKLPDEVIISVEGRNPIAIIPYLSSYLVIDVNGFIMDILRQDNQPALPIIEGIHIANLTKGSLLEVSKSDNYRYKILTRMLEAVDEWEMTELIEVLSLDTPDDISLHTRDGVQVKIGQATDLERKLSWLQSEAYAEVLVRDQEGVLDVSVPGKAVFRPDAPGEEDRDEENTDEEPLADEEPEE